jgi:hypothetical protein
MGKLNLAAGLVNDLDGWTKALEMTLGVASYKRFLEVTSSYVPIVVENDAAFPEFSSRNKCHINCRSVELDGKGRRVSGWYIINEFVSSDFPRGMMRLVHHSNVLLVDDKMINPTFDYGNSHHLFLRDDERDYDFDKDIGYNDRMVFGDEFMLGADSHKAVPRNKVLFAADGEFDRDLYYEKFTVHKSTDEVLAACPILLSEEEKRRWITLKSSARFGK